MAQSRVKSACCELKQMRRLPEKAEFILRLCLGLSILLFLLHKIDTNTYCVGFHLAANASATEGATYADVSDPSHLLVVVESITNSSLLKTIQKTGIPARLDTSGTLRLVAGYGDNFIQWNSWQVSQSGLGFLRDVFCRAFRKWPWLLCGLLLYFVAIAAITVRWKLVLNTQNVQLAWKRMLSIAFMGVFFNSFMPGSVGGDLVRGFYTSRESRHGKTELFFSVFIDRMLGMPSILILPILAMLLRPDLTFSHPVTRIVFFVLLLLIFLMASLVLVFFRYDLFERIGLLRQLESKASVGEKIRRVYAAFRLCLTHPKLVMEGFLLSIAGQSVGVAAAFCFARALGEHVSFADFYPLCLIVMVVAGIPLTPGGLGMREGATILLMSAVGITAAKALALSLLMYAGTLLCGIIGALAFVLHSGLPARATTGADQDRGHP